MKRLTILFILFVSMLSLHAEIKNGKCGDSVTYTLNTETGVLKIEGSGRMYDYSSSAPWYTDGRYITKVELYDGLLNIGNCAFEGCSNLISIDIPSTITSIGQAAFYGCFSLTSIEIPNSVTSIGRQAFCNCYDLTSAVISNSVTSIQFQTFAGCGLTSIEIPNSVTSIDNYAFNGCVDLTSIEIPNSVTNIGQYAFRDCEGLTFIEIPNSITSISEFAFSGCSGLTSIKIPKSVMSIESSAFKGCSGLASIEIPNSVMSIGSSAFENCSGLASIEIPNSVTKIGNTAFQNCKNLTSVEIPNSITSISYNTFAGCSGLTFIKLPNSVTSIGQYAFAGCSSLASVEIPNSVTAIGDYAFRACSSLTSVEIPNPITSIGNYVFKDCTSLTSPIYTKKTFVKLPTSYKGYYEIPSNIEFICGGAFYECSDITFIEIPNSVTNIGEFAFYNSGITSIDIPNSVTNIGQAAFSGCRIRTINWNSNCSTFPFEQSYLTELYIGDDVTILNKGYGSYFKNLRKVVLGKKVSQIRSEAFSNTWIKEFYVTSDEIPTCYPNLFQNVKLGEATLYVPLAKIETYQTTEPWKNFGKIMTLEGNEPERPEDKICETPVISYEDGILSISSSTPGSQCYYSLTSDDVVSNQKISSQVKLNGTYVVSVYAMAEGYKKSEIATQNIELKGETKIVEVPIEVEKIVEVPVEIEVPIYIYDDSHTNIEITPYQIITLRIQKGVIHIENAPLASTIYVYDTKGEMLRTQKVMSNDEAFTLARNAIYIMKVGEKTFKVKI